MEILLVVGFGIIEGAQVLNNRHHGSILVPAFLELVLDVVGNDGLLLVHGEDGAPVLGAYVGALAVHGGWVVHLEEKLHQLLIRDVGGLVGDENGLGAVGCARAHLFIGRVDHGVVSVGVADPDVDDLRWNRKVLAEQMLHPPEAACRKHRIFRRVCFLDFRDNVHLALCVLKGYDQTHHACKQQHHCKMEKVAVG